MSLSRRWRKPINVIEKESVSFKTVTELAFTEDGRGCRYIALDKSLNLNVKRVAWLNNGKLVDDTQGVFNTPNEDELSSESDIDTENKSFALMHRLTLLTQNCPTMYWEACGDFSHLIFPSKNSEEYRRVSRYLAHETYTVRGQSPWKFAAIKFQDSVYVYPHHLFYLLKQNYYQISDEFKFAIMFGEPLSKDDVVEKLPENQYEHERLHRLQSTPKGGYSELFYAYYLMKNYDTQPIPSLPKKYLAKSTEYVAVNVEVPINMDGTSLDGAEYKMQEFYLPKNVEKSDVKAILARQSLDLLALTEMRNTFVKLKQACKGNPSLAAALAGLVTDNDKIDLFQCEVANGDNDFNDYRESLVERSTSLFPFQP